MDSSFSDAESSSGEQNKQLIEALKKVGPHSKAILNYSYPPLLYQRGGSGSESEEDEDDEEDMDEYYQQDEEDESHMMMMSGDLGQLPQLHDSDDDEELIRLEE